MKVKIFKEYLNHRSWKVESLHFVPQNRELKAMSIFTHGHTASKNDLILWAQLLAHKGHACLIFDLPGHYLGSFNEVLDFQEFTQYAHELFLCAHKAQIKKLKIEKLPFEHLPLLLGGHSLGGMLSLKAWEYKHEFLQSTSRLQWAAVGVGLSYKNGKHLMLSPFWADTLNIRRQLVSPALNPEDILPWIAREKELLAITQEKIALIVGENDIIVGEDGLNLFKMHLEANHNHIELIRPSNLPHHHPEMAASFLTQLNP